ncbi:MAG: hypothetical protein WKG01_30535 [Kofleriaceae bacterium]
MSQIDSKLDSAASELSGIERKSDATDITDAQDYVREVERVVEDLKRVKGSDSAAERIVANYPGYIREFRTASDELKKLKHRQTKADEILRQCKSFDTAMSSRANAAKDDPEAADELTEFARVTGRKGEELLADAGRMWSEIERSRDDAKRFSASDGRWSNVRSNLHSGAEAIARGWRDDWDNAKRACEEVVKRERHRDVDRVLAKLANSRTGRAELRKKLNELLEDVSDRIKDVQSQNGTTNVSSALELAKELESQLERLKNAAGDDRDSKAIASTWPAWVRGLRESLETLKEMKFNQHRADDGEDKCEAAEKKLEELIKRVLEDREDYSEPDKTISEEAERLGNPIEQGLKAAGEVDRKMGDWESKAKSFSQSDGKWSRVSSNLRDSAERVYAHWRTKFGAMSKACASISKGGEHPKVKSTLDQLSGKSSSTTGQLDHDVKDWVDRARATYRLDCDAMQDMWQAYCGTDWQPNDNDAGDGPKQIAAQLQDRMQKAMLPLLKDLPPLVERVKALVRKRATKSRGDDLMGQLEKQRARLNRLSTSGTWHGSNDPIRFYAAEYGKDQHKRLWSSFGCNVPLAADKEARFPGSGHTKPDCVNAEKCQVWEFKPDSLTGRVDGPRQASAYRDIVPSYYTAKHQQNQPAETQLGGGDIMKTLSSRCLRGGEIKFEINVHYYKMCDNRYECVRE